mgnify:CR=1 FL=1
MSIKVIYVQSYQKVVKCDQKWSPIVKKVINATKKICSYTMQLLETNALMIRNIDVFISIIK